MSDNMAVVDGHQTNQTIRTTESGGIHTPHQKAELQVGGVDVASGNPVPVTLVGGEEVATTVSEGSSAVTAGVALDLIAASASPSGKAFRNRGPNDASYRVGVTATGSPIERVLLVGEEKQLPYRSIHKVSFYSTAGTTIEWEQWS
jgi:hypothetical protein